MGLAKGRTHIDGRQKGQAGEGERLRETEEGEREEEAGTDTL